MATEKLPIVIDWFCPNGHEVFSPKLAYNEPPKCGSCGAVMSIVSGAFDDVIESIERRGIEDFEKAQAEKSFTSLTLVRRTLTPLLPPLPRHRWGSQRILQNRVLM